MKAINKPALDKMFTAYKALEQGRPEAAALMEEALAALPEGFLGVMDYSRDRTMQGAVAIAFKALEKGDTDEAFTAWATVCDMALRVNDRIEQEALDEEE